MDEPTLKITRGEAKDILVWLCAARGYSAQAYQLNPELARRLHDFLACADCKPEPVSPLAVTRMMFDPLNDYPDHGSQD